MSAQPVIALPQLPDELTFDPSELEDIDGDQLLQDVSAFIGRYLHCSEHQRILLALWAMHTHAFVGIQVTPYLAIQSAEKQSGKTLCLHLLSLLCNDPVFTAGFTVNTLSRRLDERICTVLLDERQGTIGTRARSKNPALRAVLAGGFDAGAGLTDSKEERNIFAPKAFAGMGELPQALADRSISIILKPLDQPYTTGYAVTHTDKVSGSAPDSTCEAPNTARSAYAVTHGDGENSGLEQAGSPARAAFARDGVQVQRFALRLAGKESKRLQERLNYWAMEHDPELEEMRAYSWEDFPSGLSPRRQDMIEPLLQLADIVGGEWPSRIREAFTVLFQEEADFALRHSIQLLADIRDCFAHFNYPERLSSAMLLDWMHSRPSRPWDDDGPVTARTIARLLAPFEIHPRPQRSGPGSKLARGYQLGDFKKHWRTHLNFEVPPRPTPEELMNALWSNSASRKQSENVEMSNKDMGGYAVTHSDEENSGLEPAGSWARAGVARDGVQDGVPAQNTAPSAGCAVTHGDNVSDSTLETLASVREASNTARSGYVVTHSDNAPTSERSPLQGNVLDNGVPDTSAGFAPDEMQDEMLEIPVWQNNGSNPAEHAAL
jgi:hypothetical protein